MGSGVIAGRRGFGIRLDSGLICAGRTVSCGGVMADELSDHQPDETDLDAELDSLFRRGEAALDDKTRAFIAEVLRHVPKEQPMRFEVEVCHEGAFCGDES